MKKIYTQPRTETVATTPQQMLCASGIKAKITGYSTNAGEFVVATNLKLTKKVNP